MYEEKVYVGGTYNMWSEVTEELSVLGLGGSLTTVDVSCKKGFL